MVARDTPVRLPRDPNQSAKALVDHVTRSYEAVDDMEARARQMARELIEASGRRRAKSRAARNLRAADADHGFWSAVHREIEVDATR